LNLAQAHRSAAGRLEMDAGGGKHYTVPVDDEGHLLLHWSRTGPEWRSGVDSKHVQAAWLLQPVVWRRALWRNERTAEAIIDEAVAARKNQVHVQGAAENPEALAYADLVLEYRKLSRELHALELREGDTREPAEKLRAQIKPLEEAIAGERKHAETE